MTVVIWGMEVNWLAQIFGLVSLVLLVIGYQRARKQFLLIMMIANLFNIVEYSLLGGWTAVIRCIIANVRNLIILIYMGKNKELPAYWIFIFTGLIIGFSAFFIDVWYAVVPPVCSIIYTIFTCQKNYRLQKVGASCCDALSVVYCLFLGAYISALRNLILVAAAIISLFVLIKKERVKSGCESGGVGSGYGLLTNVDINKEEMQ